VGNDSGAVVLALDQVALARAVDRAGYKARLRDGGGVTRVTVEVEGMHCASCVSRIESALRGVGGVCDASVNLAAEQAEVAYDPRRVKIESLIEAILDT
jgi:Cu+-exporting ATPase